MASKVLIVEDEILVALDLEALLQAHGYKVVAIAADADEAVASGPQAEIALVDVNLRDGPTGIEIARELSRHGVTVMFVTANPRQVLETEQTPPALGVLTKPIEQDALIAALDYAHKKRAAEDAAAQAPPNLVLLKP